MTTLSEIFTTDRPVVSIEVFPPKTEKGDLALFKMLDCLTQYKPQFVSCTYGAGGSVRTRTIDLCQQIQQRYNIPTTAHLTCVGSTRDEIIELLKDAKAAGIQNIMALRGDAPEGAESFETVSDGLSYADELVQLINENFPEIGMGVAAYPEKHTEAADLETDLQNLKRKIDAGADVAFTQLFFVNDNFYRFREMYQQAGCKIPLVPGIMPITEFARIKRITAMCGAIFPDELAAKLEAVQDDKEAQMEIGVNHAIAQCQDLLNQGAPGIHFYALNKSQACQQILEALNL
ncbi:MAG: methylenetetrahydrofolate reductase [NAD(P)H] [Planctomycetaceae bacterium]|nr:methylenetetrahydrofolate reductase [NAD(P)H] [Planctomycetaceae bacterium]